MELTVEGTNSSGGGGGGGGANNSIVGSIPYIEVSAVQTLTGSSDSNNNNSMKEIGTTPISSNNHNHHESGSKKIQGTVGGIASKVASTIGPQLLWIQGCNIAAHNNDRIVSKTTTSKIIDTNLNKEV